MSLKTHQNRANARLIVERGRMPGRYCEPEVCVFLSQPPTAVTKAPAYILVTSTFRVGLVLN
jgi:hypothetical protein